MKKEDIKKVDTWDEHSPSEPEGTIVNHHGNVMRVDKTESHHGVMHFLIPVGWPKKSKRVKKTGFTHRDGRAYVRIKIKSLSEEIKIIKLEERKTPSLSRMREMQMHRSRLKQITRASQLAYAIIRGKQPWDVERSGGGKGEVYEAVTISRDTCAMIAKYGDQKLTEADVRRIADTIHGWLVIGRKAKPEMIEQREVEQIVAMG